MIPHLFPSLIGFTNTDPVLLDALHANGGDTASLTPRRFREYGAAAVSLPHLGVELSFSPRATYASERGQPRGNGPYVLDGIFYMLGDGESTYAGLPPFASVPIRVRDDALQVYGRPVATDEDGDRIDGDDWRIQGFHLSLTYRHDLSLRQIAVSLPRQVCDAALFVDDAASSAASHPASHPASRLSSRADFAPPPVAMDVISAIASRAAIGHAMTRSTDLVPATTRVVAIATAAAVACAVDPEPLVAPPVADLDDGAAAIDYTAFISHSLDHPPLREALAGWTAFAYVDAEDLAKAVENGRLTLFDRDIGACLFFTDAESYTRRFGDPLSLGDLVLTRVTMFGHFPEVFATWRGPLPRSLTMDADFPAWQAALGKPVWTMEVRGQVRKARWQRDGGAVDVSFREDGLPLLASVLALRRASALVHQAAARVRHHRLPSPDRWLELIGTPLDTLAALPECAELSLQDHRAEALSYDRVDFTAAAGLDVNFRSGEQLVHLGAISQPVRAVPCLSGVRYHCDLDFKAQPWLGPMPFGISFDDPPAVVIAKVGRAPDRESADVTEGAQCWRFGRHELHVLYSLVEDHVQRVTLRAIDPA